MSTAVPLYVASAFKASEIYELEPRSESFTRSLLEGMKGEEGEEGEEGSKRNCLIPLPSFIQWSARFALPTRSAAKNGGCYYTCQVFDA
jgi:hypothetical protein